MIQTRINQVSFHPTGSSKMVELADAIVAVWSGVYNLASHPDKVKEQSGTITPPLLYLQATAAAHVIRLR